MSEHFGLEHVLATAAVFNQSSIVSSRFPFCPHFATISTRKRMLPSFSFTPRAAGEVLSDPE